MGKYRRRRSGVAGIVKMLIRETKNEESNHRGRCDSHDNIMISDI
jgi:hypothetical protein